MALTKAKDAAQEGVAAVAPGALLQGRYRVGAALGRGAFGTTYRGLDIETHLPVAIKVEHAHVKRSTLGKRRLKTLTWYQYWKPPR